MAVANQLVNSEKKPPSVGNTIATFLSGTAVRKNIENVVGEMNSTRFVTSVVSAVNNTPALKECTNVSIFSAALLGQGLELSPSPQLGHFYMVPFENKKAGTKEATFVLGYKGYIQLALRSGQYRNINVIEVKKGEFQGYDPFAEELRYNPILDFEKREEAETVGYYAMFELLNGFKKQLYWTKERMIAHADKYSAAFSKNATSGKYPKVSFADYEAGNYDKRDAWLYSSNWYQNFDEMAKKTMIRQLIGKWGPMSIDMQAGFEADNAVIDEQGVPTTYAEQEEYRVEATVVEPQEQETVVEQPVEQPQTQGQSEEDINAILFS